MFLATLLVAGHHLSEEAAPPLIDVDGTVLIQFVLFVIMLIVLSRLLFRPYLNMRAERGKGIEGARHEAETMEHRAEAIVTDYDARMTRAKMRGGEERTKLRSEAAVYERQVLGAARDESHKALAEARGQVQTQAAAAKKSLETQAGVLARQMAKKILGREVA